MNAANSASRAAPTHAASTTRVTPQRPVRTGAPALHSAERGDEFKLNLADIPRASESLDVEGFKPSLLSRLFNLVAPIR